MEIIYKQLEATNRGMYLYYPNQPMRTAFKRSAIIILRDDSDVASVQRLLEDGLADLAEREEIVLCFPNPMDSGWNDALDPNGPDDLTAIQAMQGAMTKPDNKPPKLLPNGIPAPESMANAWHPMNDVKYLAGIGTGASMACALAAVRPDNIAGVLSLEGRLEQAALAQAAYAPMPILLAGEDSITLDYFIKANEAAQISDTLYENPINPLQRVERLSAAGSPGAQIANAWESFFANIRRTNTGAHGDIQPRMRIKDEGFELYLDDDRLALPDGLPRTWFVHVPKAAQTGKTPVPLMMFFHGASDNPAEAAEMSKFHQLGEKEGFITVYPWGTNKLTWYSNMDAEGPDDVGYTLALIRHMLANYPVDPQRVYLSGFSNGAAHAQAVAMIYPEHIAAICHIDSNWPGQRVGATDIRYEDIPPMRIGLERKEEFDYRMPVWYTYGTREPSYPVYRGCSQQHQYDYWKTYNNIEIQPTPGQDAPHPCGCGVPGQKVEHPAPSARHPHHRYDVHRFYAKDDPTLNLYNYVMMRDKGHDIAEMDPALGWAYVKQFRRLPGGALQVTEE